jgi:hypothetical protein
MTTQTVWLPTSSALVSQHPLRKKPVIGRVEQMSSVPPSTLRDGLRPGRREVSSNGMAASMVARGNISCPAANRPMPS